MNVCDALAPAIETAVRRSVAGKDVAVAFSGGLDSGIVAALAKKHAGSATLYTAGTAGAYDVNESKEISGVLDMRWEHVFISDRDLLDSVVDMIGITGVRSPVTLSFEIPLYYVSKHCAEEIILSGQGADELFAGFAKYVGLSENELRETMDADMAILLNQTLASERAIAANFGKTVHYPYLDPEVRDLVADMDIRDLMPDKVRKECLRWVAETMGYPEIAAKKKKAAQYGSGAMRRLRAIAKGRGTTVNGLIRELSGETD